MYRRIVVPLDGSELAEQALDHAEQLARLTGSPLHLIRVVDFTRLERYGPYGLAIEYASVEPVMLEEQAKAVAYLQAIEQRLIRQGLAVDHEIRRGPVTRELVAAARADDLFVMASHGRGGLPRWLLGSVAEDVVRHAPAPVLLVRAFAANAGVATHRATGAGAPIAAE